MNILQGISRRTALIALAAIAALIVVIIAWRISASKHAAPAAVEAAGAPSATQVQLPPMPAAEAAYFTLAAGETEKGDIAKAKETYQKFIEKYPASNNIIKAQEEIDNCNVKLLFSSDITPNSQLYEVRKGDNLTKIAKKFKTTVELLTKANNIKGSAIRVGMKLKVPKVKFSVIVSKSQKILTLKADGEIFKTYRVAVGKEKTPTPAGTFTVTNKIVDPPWYKLNGKMVPAGDPKNELGSRWLGISRPSYGIHGTIRPESIGQNATEGCVRMKNSDVEELFAIVPEGTEVTITE